MRKAIIIAAALFALPALAQQPAPQPAPHSPEMQAVYSKLNEEMAQNLQLRAKVFELSALIEKRKAEDDEAAQKAAPKK